MCDQGDTGLAGYCHHITSNCRLCMYLSSGYLLIFPKTSYFILVALVWCVCKDQTLVTVMVCQSSVCVHANT